MTAENIAEINDVVTSLTKEEVDTKEKIQTSIEAVSIATIILISFSVIGKFILSYLSISLASFRIAGGLILLW